MTSGNMILVACRDGNNTGSSKQTAPTDTVNTYSLVTGTFVGPNGNSAGEISWFKALAASSATLTPRCNFSPSQPYDTIVAVQISGANTTGVTNTASCTNACSTPLTSGSVGPSHSGEMVLTFGTYANNNLTWSAAPILGTNGTLTKCANGTTGGDSCAEYRATGSGSGTAAIALATNNNTWLLATMSVYQTSGGTTPAGSKLKKLLSLDPQID